MNINIKGYNETQGMRLIKALASYDRNIFSVEDIQKVSREIDISPAYFWQLLSMLHTSGWLERIHRGVYALSGILSGFTHIHPFSIATQMVKPSAISHWSAMSHYGFTEQIPQIVMAITTRKVTTPSMHNPDRSEIKRKHAWKIDGVNYEYMTVKSEHYFGIEEIWIDRNTRIPITDRERTLLSAITHPRIFGGMGEVISILSEHIGEVNVNKLVEYAVQYGCDSAAKRLGWSLEKVGVDENIMTPLLNIRVNGLRILDPTLPRSGKSDRRWNILNNLELNKV